MVAPLFFIKSSNLEFSIDYPNLKLESKKSIIIQNTVYSFKDNFIINASAYGYFDNSFNFNHRESEKLIVLDEIPVQVIFKIKSNDNYEIRINNDKYDIDNIFLLKGSYPFTIMSEKYLTYESVLNIDKYSEKLFLPILQKKISKSVIINSSPNDVAIHLNGKNIGYTPHTMTLTKKYNEIELLKAGYKKSSSKIFVTDNNTKIFFYELEKQDKLTIIKTTPSQATLFLNDEYMGLTPFSLNDSLDGVIKISKQGYKDFVYKLNEKESNLNFKLEESMSDVIINSEPVSKVFINDEFIGNTPLEIELQQIKHKVSLKNDLYQTVTKIIEPQKENFKIFEKLVTKKQSILNNSPNKYTNSVGSELILFKPGQVTLGSSKNQSRRDINEIVRNVSISKHFYISKNLITEKQFNDFLNINLSSNLPVNNISWVQAAKFCNWLSSKENLSKFYIFIGDKLTSVNKSANGYRLPSEAEWEYVSKSNSNINLIYQWGNNRKINKLVGNIGDQTASSILQNYVKDYNDGYISRSPIGTFKPNQNNIYDLTGNLSEWVNDFYSYNIISPETILIDYIGPTNGSSHVIKGSNFNSSSPLQLGISYRTYGKEKSELVGFRVARWIY